MQDIPAATESAGQAAAAVDGVVHVLAAGEEAELEDQEQQEGVSLAWVPDSRMQHPLLFLHRCFHSIGRLNQNMISKKVWPQLAPQIFLVILQRGLPKAHANALGRKAMFPTYFLAICDISSIEALHTGEEDAEDSDDEINENLDVDAAADAFAAAAREKGFGDGPQHTGEPGSCDNRMLLC